MEIPSIFQTKQQHRKDGEELLIFPGPHVYNHRWTDYRIRWLRSMHIDARTESIISCGFPKFMALGDGSDAYKLEITDILKSKDLIATSKIDGTCLIRYVFDGKVHWRTKQSFYVQLENEFEIPEFQIKYPKLADPLFCSEITLMFEWVSPFNEIVVKYPEPTITLIGAVKFTRDVPWHEADIKLLQMDALAVISEECEVPLVENFKITPASNVVKLIEQTNEAETMEGYVLRLNDDQELVKIKSYWWLLVFSCKIMFSTAMAVELWLYWLKPSWETYNKKFVETFNDEAWTIAMPIVASMYDGMKQAQKIIEHIRKFCEANKGLSHNEFYRLATDRFNMLRMDIAHAIRKGEEVPGHIWKKLILQNTAQMDKVLYPV